MSALLPDLIAQLTGAHKLSKVKKPREVRKRRSEEEIKRDCLVLLKEEPRMTAKLLARLDGQDENYTMKRLRLWEECGLVRSERSGKQRTLWSVVDSSCLTS